MNSWIYVSKVSFFLRDLFFSHFSGKEKARIVSKMTCMISFDDRFDLTRAAVAGRKTSIRVVIGKDRRLAPYYPLFTDIPVAMCYNDMMKFNQRCLREMHDGDVIKDIYRAEFGNDGWIRKESAKPELMLFSLQMTGHRIQHLQDITDEEILKEGIKDFGDGRFGFTDLRNDFMQNRVFDSPREAYAALMDASEGEGTWSRNPWVLVLDFRTNDRNRELSGD